MMFLPEHNDIKQENIFLSATLELIPKYQSEKIDVKIFPLGDFLSRIICRLFLINDTELYK